jgi:hypothetical protein
MDIEFKLGADPELFIFDNKAGKLISAHGLFPGTKEDPYAVEHGAIQVDGMAAEYNILPASTAEQFVFYNLSVLRSLRDEIAKRNPDLDFSFRFQPVADFGAEYIAEQPEEARRLGCTPDFNAWEGGQANPAPDAEMPFRTASGHIHVGWGDDYEIDDPEHIEACCMMVKQIDAGFAPLFVQLEGEEGKRRRKLYGKAGAFRPKKYGVEYRVLSNSWLTDVYYMKQLFINTRQYFNDLMAGYQSYQNSGLAMARKWIDTGNLAKMEYNWGKYESDYYNKDQFHPVTMETLDKLYEKYAKLAGVPAYQLVAIDDLDHLPDLNNMDDDQPDIDWNPIDNEDEFEMIELAPWQGVRAGGLAQADMADVEANARVVFDIEVNDWAAQVNPARG